MKEELKNKKKLKETLSVFLSKKNKEKNKSQIFVKSKKEMIKASNSYKSIMEIHNILVNVYNKIINK